MSIRGVSYEQERDRWRCYHRRSGNRVVQLRFFLGCIEPCLVIEDVAVLVDLDERGPFMVGGAFQDHGQVFDVHVDGPGDKRSFGTDGDREWA